MIKEIDFSFLDEHGFWEYISNIFFLKLQSPIAEWGKKFAKNKNIFFDFLSHTVYCYFNRDGTLAYFKPDFFQTFDIEDSKILFQNADRIKHIGLRSLVFDTLWQYRKLGKDSYIAAIKAIEGYKKAIEIPGNKEFVYSYDYGNILQHISNLSLSISYKKGIKYVIDKGEFFRSLPYSEKNSNLIILGLTLLLNHSLPNKQVKSIVNKVLNIADNQINVFLIKQRYYELALSFAQQIKDKTLTLDIKKSIAETYKHEAEKCSNEFQKAHLLQQAIEAYKRIPGSENIWKPLMHKFAESSANGIAKFNFATFAFPLDPNGQLKKYAEQIKTKLSNTSLEYKLLYFASQLSLLSSEEDIIKQLPSSDIEEMMTSAVYNSRGQLVRIFTGKSVRERASFYRAIDIHWTILYNSVILPLLSSVKKEHCITDLDLIHYCQYSPFVPEGYERLYATGFSNWFSGKNIEAISILIPLLENSLREIISRFNPDIPVFKFKDGGICEDIIDMKGLLDICREKHIVDEKIIFNLEILLIEKSNNIRNNIAHGKYDYEEFLDIKTQILMWIIFWFIMNPHLVAKKKSTMKPII